MNKNPFKSDSLNDFLGIGKDIIPETKDFLFQLMAETALEETGPSKIKEDRIYLICQLHQLLTGIERETSNPD